MRNAGTNRDRKILISENTYQIHYELNNYQTWAKYFETRQTENIDEFFENGTQSTQDDQI